MYTQSKKMFACLLALVMVFQIAPVSVFAAAPEGFFTATSNEVIGTEYYTVTFLMDDETTIVTQLFSKEAGAAIGNLPENPFKAGFRFAGWEDRSGVPITAATIVNSNIEAIAQFELITVHTVTVEYYYEYSGTETVFHTVVEQLEKGDTPRVINSPPATQVPGSVDPYYPQYPFITITEDDLIAQEIVKRVKLYYNVEREVLLL